MLPDLASLFESLPTPEAARPGEPETFFAASVPGWGKYRLIRDRDGNPGLLVETPADKEGLFAPLHLRNVSFAPSLACRIHLDNGHGQAREGTFAAVRCKTSDAELHRFFLTEAATWLGILGEAPSVEEIATAVMRLADLFQAITRAPRDTVYGLWGELLVIAQSRDAELLVRAWHCDPADLYDFVSEQQILEVKTTGSPLRRHAFALRQLQPPRGSRLLIASVIAKEVPSGISVDDLVARVKERLNPRLRFRVDEMVILTLGLQWRDAFKTRFDETGGVRSIQLYDHAVIPTVDPRLPPEVTEVRFAADLTGVEPLSSTEVNAHGELFCLRTS